MLLAATKQRFGGSIAVLCLKQFRGDIVLHALSSVLDTTSSRGQGHPFQDMDSIRAKLACTPSGVGLPRGERETNPNDVVPRKGRLHNVLLFGGQQMARYCRNRA